MSVESFADEFISNIKRTTDTRLYLNTGGYITQDADKLKEWTLKNKKFLRDTDNSDLLALDDDDSKLREFFARAMKKVIDLTKKTLDPKIKIIMETMNSKKEDSVEIDVEHFHPIIDLEEKQECDKFKMIHASTNQFIPNFSFNSWKECVGHESFGAMKGRIPHGIFRYNPREPRSIYDGTFAMIPTRTDSNITTTVYNTYTRPRWRINPVSNPKCPEEMKRFFGHLFPDYGCRRYVFEKIYQVLEDRVGVFLVMNGVTGIGKGLFSEELMEFGVGNPNFMIAPVSWDKSGFNAWLKNKQVLVLDETKVETDGHGKENVNLLKRIINEQQSIEEKGKDPTLAIRSFASFFITSNNGVKNFKLELDNRRFSVLDLTNQKMRKAFEPEEHDAILHALTKDDDKRAEFFWWILKTFKPEAQRYPDTLHLWKGPTYWKLRYQSLPRWKQFIVDICTGKEAKPKYCLVSINNIWEEYCENKGYETKRWGINMTTLEDFLEEYHHLDEDPIGRVIHQGKQNFIEVNDKFLSRKAKIKIEKEYEDVNDL